MILLEIFIVVVKVLYLWLNNGYSINFLFLWLCLLYVFDNSIMVGEFML